jgi:opacity protein-like surface antigen
MKRFAFALACVVAATLPAIASDDPPPVKIDQCVMGQAKSGDDTSIGHGVAFTNISHHAITAIRFNFTFETKFNDIVGGTLETDTGSFSPGISIDHTKKSVGQQVNPNDPLGSIGSFNPFGKKKADLSTYYWQVTNPSQETIDHLKVVCTVDAITYEDGNVWKAPQ